MKSYLSVIIILLTATQGFCQINNTRRLHAFSGTMVVSLESGFTLGKTDYKNTKPGGRLTMGIEYYLPTSSIHILGFRAFGGGQQIYSKEEDKIVAVPNIGSILLPDLIKTDMYIMGIGVIYSLSIKDRLFPYISGGLSNIWFSPKTENGSRALFNSLNKYKRNALVYDLDLGIKYQIINNLSVKLEGGFHFPNTDNLDDIATGKDKDFYATGIIGISYSFFGKKDTDGDGILDDVDKCPDQPEDFDGFQDDDGCPDFDNDSDGVPDSVDNCPNVPGSVANKGCPDESQNDSTYTTAPKEIVIEGEATFAPGTANILPEAHTELNRIVKLLELYPDINWRIEGYTDKVSTENLLVRPLSQRRAEAILNYFVSKGLPSFQFRVYDMGNKFPIANNNTEYGRKKNRRVVLVREN